MKRFTISKQFDCLPCITDRVSTVCRMFGLGLDRFEEHRKIHSCDIDVEDGDIVYITGPSGAGKSVLLRELRNIVPADQRISIDDIQLPSDKSAVDSLPPPLAGVVEILSLLATAGLSDVFCILTAPANLSEGQKYRFRLACALASGKKFIFADEFCSNLDRITAAVIAYNVRKFAGRNNVTFFLASSHQDILADLQPDVLVVKQFTGPAEVTYKLRK